MTKIVATPDRPRSGESDSSGAARRRLNRTSRHEWGSHAIAAPRCPHGLRHDGAWCCDDSCDVLGQVVIAADVIRRWNRARPGRSIAVTIESSGSRSVIGVQNAAEPAAPGTSATRVARSPCIGPTTGLNMHRCELHVADARQVHLPGISHDGFARAAQGAADHGPRRAGSCVPRFPLRVPQPPSVTRPSDIWRRFDRRSTANSSSAN